MPLYLGTENAGTDQFSLQDFEPSFGSKLSAAVRESWLESYGPSAVDWVNSRVRNDGGDKLSADEANAKIKEAGVPMKLSPKDGEYTSAQLDILTGRARDLAAAKDVRDRTPWDMGSVVRGGAMFAAGIVDPINLATAFVPWTKSISALRGVRAASMAESFATRTGARAVLGAADAGISTAVLEPLYYAGRTQLGDDYTAYDSLANIAFGTAFGGGIHSVGGAAVDFLKVRLGGETAWDKYRGLRTDQIRQVMDYYDGVRAGGADAEKARNLAQGFSPEMRRAAGLPDLPAAIEAGGAPEISPEARSGVNPVTAEPYRQPSVFEASDHARMFDERIRDLETRLTGLLQDQSQLANKGDIARAREQLASLSRPDDSDAASRELAKFIQGRDGVSYKNALSQAKKQIAASVADYEGQRGALESVIEKNAQAQQKINNIASINDELTMLRESREQMEAPLTMETDISRAARSLFNDQPARFTIGMASPETREAALRASVAQMVDGRNVEVEALVGTDAKLNTAQAADTVAAAEKNFTPQEQQTVDFDAARRVENRVQAEAKKNFALEDANQAMADADAALRDSIRAGDQAFKYAREQAQSRGPRPEGSPSQVETITAALEKEFGQSTKAMLDAGKVSVVERVEDLPGGPHPGDVKAVTTPDGKVYMVAENISPWEARGLILHEVGVHVGMENMLGREVFQSVLAQLDEAIARGEKWTDAARIMVPKDTPAQYVREEQLAYLVQYAPEQPLVKKIIASIKAWFIKTFPSLGKSLSLTEADYQALAISALHAVARGEADAPRRGGALYARGAEKDPSTISEELKPFDERIARAKQYANVLRAAADKLGNDAQAAEAMKAAMPDITATEVKDLLDQLKQQVAGLREVTRTVGREAGAEELASGTQYEAMQAADTLANNIEMAEVIERRNAALNINARLKAASFIGQFSGAKLDVEAFRALLVGTERKRQGARISVDAEQKNFKGEWIGGLLADMEKEGLTRAYISGAFDRDTYNALWAMGRNEDTSALPKEAVKMAEIINKYQTDARNTRNRFGAWIRDLQGYIVRQSHDMYKIRDAGMDEWAKFTYKRLDIKKMQDLGLIDSLDPVRSIRELYNDFATGNHMKPVAGETDTVAFKGGANLAKKESQSRSLYFKDGNAAFEYNERFGEGRLADAVIGGLDHAARSAGLLKVLGTNPEATLTRLFDEHAQTLISDPKRYSQFVSSRKEILENLLGTVDGSVNVPGNVTAAKVGSFLRAWQSMAKLGGALISSVSDLANYAAELRFSQDKNLLTGTLDGIGAVIAGRAKGERADVLNALGVFHESTLGSIFHRFDSPDLVGGKTAWAMQQFYKLNGLTWWTESLRDGFALQHSNYLASNTRHSFDKLPEALRDMMSLYNIDAGKWEILRKSTMQADGRMYMTPDALKTVPIEMFENYIRSTGRAVNDASVMNLQDDLASALRTMTIDRMHHAVIEPGARTRAFMLRGTQPGTVPGELLRYVTQFKSFPIAMIQMVLGREVYGRGYDTLGDYLKNGRGDMLGLATFIGLSTMMGYAAMSTKDLLKGKNPRPADDPATWAAAMVQGGGLGIYGDFLFNKYNRMGGSFSSSLIGPVPGLADTAADLWTRIRTGDDVAATAFNAALQNTPFMNLFYTRTAMDYLILYRMQEAMNPGFLHRMERRVERENHQTFYLPPTQYAR